MMNFQQRNNKSKSGWSIAFIVLLALVLLGLLTYVCLVFLVSYVTIA